MVKFRENKSHLHFTQVTSIIQIFWEHFGVWNFRWWSKWYFLFLISIWCDSRAQFLFLNSRYLHWFYSCLALKSISLFIYLFPSCGIDRDQLIRFWEDFATHWTAQSHRCYFRICRCWCSGRESLSGQTMPSSPYADVAIERQNDSRAPESAPQFYLHPSHRCRRFRDPCRAMWGRLWRVSILHDDFGTRFWPAIVKKF